MENAIRFGPRLPSQGDLRIGSHGHDYVPACSPIVAALLSAAEYLGFASASASDRISDDEIMSLVRKHCVMCHSQNPSHTMFRSQLPPKGVVLDTIEDVRKLGDRIMIQVVQLKYMPLGNETGLKDEERAKFGAWITGN